MRTLHSFVAAEATQLTLRCRHRHTFTSDIKNCSYKSLFQGRPSLTSDLRSTKGLHPSQAMERASTVFNLFGYAGFLRLPTYNNCQQFFWNPFESDDMNIRHEAKGLSFISNRERRHVSCVGVGGDRTHAGPLRKSRVCPP